MKFRLPIKQPKFNEMQLKAQKTALENYESDIKNYAHVNEPLIYCPFCGKRLRYARTSKYETLFEHVSCQSPTEKNGYTCDCELGKLWEWNEYGETYVSKLYLDMLANNTISKDEKKAIIEKHDSIYNGFMDSPFNSINASSEISVYKKFVTAETFIMKWFFPNKIKLLFEHNYDVDDFCRIKKHTVSLKFWIKDDDNFKNGCWAIDIWKWLFKQFMKERKNENYKEMFKKSYNRSWPYRWFEFFTKIVFFKSYSKYKSSL